MDRLNNHQIKITVGLDTVLQPAGHPKNVVAWQTDHQWCKKLILDFLGLIIN